MVAIQVKNIKMANNCNGLGMHTSVATWSSCIGLGQLWLSISIIMYILFYEAVLSSDDKYSAAFYCSESASLLDLLCWIPIPINISDWIPNHFKLFTGYIYVAVYMSTD